jgi:hypothetical protein
MLLLTIEAQLEKRTKAARKIAEEVISFFMIANYFMFKLALSLSNYLPIMISFEKKLNNFYPP